MATISELNVRLGLLYQDFDKSLGAVEKRLERSGRKFSQLGNDLTLAITAPLAALGASAIQQAGEIESLKLAMTSTFETAGRSAADATAEVEALRTAAKEPGLDFEQAVKGSIRLQGVGLAAEEARNILVQMANAIALTGGTADDLDGVTRQFSQMIAKGRVLQEDVSIIAERMPRISNLMQQAFGTASVEAIRESGVSAKEFVERITEAATALPRVEGGIKNALVNAGAEARNSLAKLGEAINKAFDVPKTLDTLTQKLAGAVEWFENLDASTQRTIVQIGAFALALGPVVKVIAAIQGTAAQAISILSGFGATLKGIGAAALNAGTKFAALNTAMKLTVIGGVIAAVTALYVAFDYLGDSIGKASTATQLVADIGKTAANSIAEEKVEAERLTDVIISQTSSLDAKKDALEKLKKISPEYYGSLSLAKGQVDGITKATEAYISSLLKAAKAQAAREKLVEIERELLDIGDKQEENANRRNAANKTFLGSLPGLQTAIDLTDNSLKKETSSLETKKKALAGLINEIEGTTSATKSSTDATGDSTIKNIGDAKAIEKRGDAYEKAVKSIEAVGIKGDILDSEVLGEKAKEVESQMERLIELGFGPNSKPIQNLKKYLVDIRAQMAAGFTTTNTAQAVVQEIDKVSAALGTLRSAQENAGNREEVIAKLVAAYPEYLRGIDLEKASLEDLDRIQKDLTKTIQEAAASRGPNVSASVNVSGALAELNKLAEFADLPEIKASVDVSGALAELEKLTQAPEIAATVDVSAALAELGKLAQIPDVSAVANIDVSGAIAELQKLEKVQIGVSTSAALAEIDKLSKSLDVLKSKDSGADLRAGAIAAITAAYPEYLKNIDLEKAGLAELESLQKDLNAAILQTASQRVGGIVPEVDTSAAVQQLADLQRSLAALRDADTGTEQRAYEIAKLVQSYPAYLKDIDLERAGIEELNEVQKDLTKTIIAASGEKVGAIIPEVETADAVAKIENLRQALDTLRNTQTGDEGRAEAIRALTSAYPDYLRNINLEVAGVQELTDLQNRLTKTIVDAAASRAEITAPIIDTTEAQKQVADLAASLDTLRSTSGGDDARAAAIKTITDAYPDYLKNIDLEKAGIKELTDLQNSLTAAIVKTAGARKSGSVSALPQLATLPTAKQVQSIELTGAEQAIAKAKEFAASLNLANQAYGALADNLSSGSGIVQIQATFAQMEAGAMNFGQAVTQSAQIFQEKYSGVAGDVLGSLSQIADGILQIQANKAEQEKAMLDEEYAAKLAAAQGNADKTAQVQKDLAAKKAAIDKKVAKDQQKVAIIQAVINTALSVTQALASAPYPFSLVLGALAAAAGAVQIATIKSQSFAEGGVVSRPTHAIVGDAGIGNPEIISPEKKMRQLFREEAGQGYNGPMELYSVIRGDDLLLTYDKAVRRRGRTT